MYCVSFVLESSLLVVCACNGVIFTHISVIFLSFKIPFIIFNFKSEMKFCIMCRGLFKTNLVIVLNC